MTEHEYHQLAEALMFTIEEQVDDCEADLDYESAEGILEIIFTLLFTMLSLSGTARRFQDRG